MASDDNRIIDAHPRPTIPISHQGVRPFDLDIVVQALDQSQRQPYISALAALGGCRREAIRDRTLAVLLGPCV
jgi:hypothetical protein